MTVAAEPLRFRWSSARDCPRKAVYEAMNAPARDYTDRERRVMYRGKSLGRDYVAFLATKHGKVWVDGDNWWVPPTLQAESRDTAAIIAEKKIAWEGGIGHADAFIVETGTIVEVLSSAHASDAMIESKLIQAVGYVEFDPDAKNGALVILNPSDFTEEVLVVTKDSRQYRELALIVRERIAEIMDALATGQLPERVCGKPSDAISHFCPYAEVCFEGWEPDPLPTIDDPELRALAVRLYEAKRKERAVKQDLGQMESERKEIEQRLADCVDVGTWEVGPLKLTRTHVVRKPTVDLRKAELAGYPVDTLAPYMKPAAAYDVWRIDRVSDEPLHDYGDEAPW